MKKIITTVGTSIFTNYQRAEIQIYFPKPYQHLKFFKDLENSTYTANKRNDDNVKTWITSNAKNGIADLIQKYWLKGIKKQNGTWSNWDSKSVEPNIEASAEIKSIIQITEKVKSDVEVYLLATDTVLSVVACELIETFFTPKNVPYVTKNGYKIYIKSIGNQEQDEAKDKNLAKKDGGLIVVDGLIVSGEAASDSFKNRGFSNLVDKIIWFVQDRDQVSYIMNKLNLSSKKRKNLIIDGNFEKKIIDKIWSINPIQIIEEINNNNGDSLKEYILKNNFLKTLLANNLYLNISGGYKALIPILTILGQLYRVPLFYIYEDSDELIEITQLPISFDWIRAQKYILALDETKLQDSSFRREYNSIIDELMTDGLIDDNYYPTIVGRIFYKYAETYSSTANVSLGKFYEHLLFFYYTNLKIYDKIELSYTIADDTNNEIDLILFKNNQIEIIEGKGLGGAMFIDSIEQRVMEQIEAWFAEDNKTERDKYILTTYRFSIWALKSNYAKKQIEALKTQYEEIKNRIEKKYSIKFVVDYTIINVEFKLNQQGNSWGEFLKKIDTIYHLIQ